MWSEYRIRFQWPAYKLRAYRSALFYVAVAILELDSSNFDIHEYTKSVRKLKDETYLTAFEEYEKKYDINGYQPEAEADKKVSVKAKDSEKDKDNEKSSGKKKDKDKKKDKKK